MKTNVFVIIPYSEPYETVYKEIVRPQLEACGFHAVRADEIPSSAVVYEDILKLIESAGLVIVEATESNKNVFFEFGVAAMQGKEIIIIASKEADLPFDTRHFRHLLYDLQDLPGLQRALGNWLKSTHAYKLQEPHKKTRSLHRGDVFDDIVDATFHIQRERDDSKREVAEYVRRGSLIPCSYIYSSDKGALRWLELCNDPLYEAYHSSVKFLSAKAKKILELLGDTFVMSSPDFVSLGPGNGHKDRILLRQLLKLLGRGSVSEDLYYYPYDVSLYMLSSAVRTVSSDTKIRNRVRIKATCSQFRLLSFFRPVYDYRKAPNLFSFLGNTLGNMTNETEVLHELRTAMFPEDILLLEVRLDTPNFADPGGSDELRKLFNFTPLEMLGIKYEPEKLRYDVELNRSQVPKTKTLVGKYVDFELDGTQISSTVVTYINHYHQDELRSVLESVGFEILDVFCSEGLALFVVRNSDNKISSPF